MKKIKFSIIVPVYNVESYLAKCIESLLQQNYENYEILLIDDFSKDNSTKIMREYQKKNEKIKCFYNKKNMGLSDTRNLGISESEGDYLLFIDSDDYVDNNFMTLIAETIEKQESPDVIYCGFYQEYKNIIEKKYGFVSPKKKLYDSEDFLISELSKRNLYAPACFAVYKRKIIIENNIRFESGLLHEDELWTPNILFFAKKIYTSDICFYHYVRRDNSITKAKDKTKNGLDLLIIAKKIKELYKYGSNKKLLKHIKNHSAMLYMKGISRGLLYRKEYKDNIDRFFPIRNASTFYDILKSIIVLISPRLYCKLDKNK